MPSAAATATGNTTANQTSESMNNSSSQPEIASTIADSANYNSPDNNIENLDSSGYLHSYQYKDNLPIV